MQIRRAFAEKPVVLVSGARQAGKTSLLQKTFPDLAYVSLDLPRAAEEAETEGETFLESLGMPAIIDEVQYAPRLFRYLKYRIDQARDRAGQYLLTGSQKFGLMEGVTESLAGRVALLECHSLSLGELERAFDRPAADETLLEWMFAGGYPELHAKSLHPNRFYPDYVATYLERDVRQIVQVRSLRDFDRFLRLCAMRSGQLVSYAALATGVGVSANTIKAWLSVLEASNVVYLLPPYYQNLGKRLIKSPKLYFLDTGFLCHLLGLRSPRDLRESSLFGAVFESLAAGQLIRHFVNTGLRPNLYFYRDVHGVEVDFVVPSGTKFHLMECKWSPNAKPSRAFDSLSKLAGEEQILSRSIITSARRPLGSRISVVDPPAFIPL